MTTLYFTLNAPDYCLEKLKFRQFWIIIIVTFTEYHICPYEIQRLLLLVLKISKKAIVLGVLG
jgi:hypothetical protein